MAAYPNNRTRILSGASSYQAAKRLGIPFRTYRMYLLYYDLTAKKHTFVTGHSALNESVLDYYSDDWRFITVLRNPVDRWISHYLYDRYKTSNHRKINCSVEEFINSERGATHGKDYISAVTVANKLGQYTDINVRIAAAKRNLERFDLVGITEDLPTFGKRMEDTFGIPMKIERVNENPARAEQENMIRSSSSLMRQIHALCEPDRELYDFARENLVGRS